ncbi:MAG: hypothetical protein HYW05_01150 [Candidatus Diapherotrites archaeon]|nr:hypothetical protein [Candidatus Diapherotrites archaeon]
MPSILIETKKIIGLNDIIRFPNVSASAADPRFIAYADIYININGKELKTKNKVTGDWLWWFYSELLKSYCDAIAKGIGICNFTDSADRLILERKGGELFLTFKYAYKNKTNIKKEKLELILFRDYITEKASNFYNDLIKLNKNIKNKEFMKLGSLIRKVKKL